MTRSYIKTLLVIASVAALSACGTQNQDPPPAGFTRAGPVAEAPVPSLAGGPATESNPGGVQFIERRDRPNGPCGAQNEYCIAFPTNYHGRDHIALFIGGQLDGSNHPKPQGFEWRYEGQQVPSEGSHPLPGGGEVYWWPNPARTH